MLPPHCPQLSSSPYSSHTPFPKSLLPTPSPGFPGGPPSPLSSGLESRAKVPLATSFQSQNINLPGLNKRVYFSDAMPAGVYGTPSTPPCCHALQPPSAWSLEPIHRGLSREQNGSRVPSFWDIKVHDDNISTTLMRWSCPSTLFHSNTHGPHSSTASEILLPTLHSDS